MRRAILKTHPDAIVTPMLVPHGTDSNKLRAKGVIAYGFTPMVLDLSTAGSMHSDQEHIPVARVSEGHSDFLRCADGGVLKHSPTRSRSGFCNARAVPSSCVPVLVSQQIQPARSGPP